MSAESAPTAPPAADVEAVRKHAAVAATALAPELLLLIRAVDVLASCLVCCEPAPFRDTPLPLPTREVLLAFVRDSAAPGAPAPLRWRFGAASSPTGAFTDGVGVGPLIPPEAIALAFSLLRALNPLLDTPLDGELTAHIACELVGSRGVPQCRVIDDCNALAPIAWWHHTRGGISVYQLMGRRVGYDEAHGVMQHIATRASAHAAEQPVEEWEEMLRPHDPRRLFTLMPLRKADGSETFTRDALAEAERLMEPYDRFKDFEATNKQFARVNAFRAERIAREISEFVVGGQTGALALVVEYAAYAPVCRSPGA